jgi:hypothetical protein
VAVLILIASLHVTNLPRVTEEGAGGVVDKIVPPEEVIGTIRRLRSG